MELKEIQIELAKKPKKAELLKLKTDELISIREEVRELRIRVNLLPISTAREDLFYEINAYISDVREILYSRREKPINIW